MFVISQILVAMNRYVSLFEDLFKLQLTDTLIFLNEQLSQPVYSVILLTDEHALSLVGCLELRDLRLLLYHQLTR